MNVRDGATNESRPIESVVKAAMTLVLVVEAVEQMAYVWRRMSRQGAIWWQGVQRREAAQLHATELGFLARRFPSRGSR